MNGIRKVSNTDPRVRRTLPNSSENTEDSLQGLSVALNTFQEIPQLRDAIESLTAENRRIWKALEKVGDKQSELESATLEIAALVEHKESHTRAHSMLDERHHAQAKSVAESIATVRSEISSIKAEASSSLTSELSKFSARIQVDIQKVFANITSLVSTNKPAPGRDQKVEVEVNLDQKEWDFKIKRDSRGLLDTVVASPRR